MRMLMMGLLLFVLAPAVRAQNSGSHKSARGVILSTIKDAALHVTLGAGVQQGAAYAFGGPQHVAASMALVGVVAFTKEYTDRMTAHDTTKKAFIDGLTIVAGGGVAAAAHHK